MSLLAALTAFVATVVAVVVLSPLARRYEWIDRPGGRKVHDGHVPLIGGAAMAAGLVAGLAMNPELRADADMSSFALSALLMMLIGAVDDKKNLSPRIRVLATVLVAFWVVRLDHFQLRNLGDLLGSGDVVTGLLAIPFTLFCVVGVVNALNMSDGVDGLAGGLAAVALAGMACAAWLAQQGRLLDLIMILLGAVFAFLCFNARTPLRKRASIFMGDGGSMFLGFALAMLFTVLTQAPAGGIRALTPATALWLLALPLMDTVSIMMERIVSGRSPFAPDRQHLHHVLLAAGYTPGQAVFILVVLAMLLCAVGLAGLWLGVPDPVMLGGFLVLFLLYYAGMHGVRARAGKA